MYIKCNSICHTDVPNLIQPRSSKASLTACLQTNWIYILLTGVETRNTDLNWLDWTWFVLSACCASFVKSVRFSSTHKNLNNIQCLIQYSFFNLKWATESNEKNVLYLVPLCLPEQTKHYLLLLNVLLLMIKCTVNLIYILMSNKISCNVFLRVLQDEHFPLCYI